MDQITKTVRLSGSASDSIEDAVAAVLGRAALTLEEIQSFEVVSLSGSVDASGVPAEYHVTLDVTFAVRESSTHA